MKAYVNKDECTGCGLCTDLCPAVFEMGTDDIAFVIVNEIPESELDAAKDAEAQCPVEAIKIKDK